MVAVREERSDDLTPIRDVNRRAFGQDQESNIVDALRASGAALLSLVAADATVIVGHIMYSPAYLNHIQGAALGPMAVVPEGQRRGIGSRLVDVGNRKLKDIGCPFVVVVGHADYYPRFGFEPASRYGITCEWHVPDDVFQVLILDAATMRGVNGLVKYRSEFSTTE